MDNHCTCGVEDCNRLLRYRIEMLRELLSAMRAAEETRDEMKFKRKEACYDPVIKQTAVILLNHRDRSIEPNQVARDRGKN
jgi:hypothetical protein